MMKVELELDDEQAKLLKNYADADYRTLKSEALWLLASALKAYEPTQVFTLSQPAVRGLLEGQQGVTGGSAGGKSPIVADFRADATTHLTNDGESNVFEPGGQLRVSRGSAEGWQGVTGGSLGGQQPITGSIVLESRADDDLVSAAFDVDRLDGSGDPRQANSPFQMRRRAQVELLQRAWAHYFPQQQTPVLGTLKGWLSSWDNSAETLLEVFDQVSGRRPPITSPKGYIEKMAATAREKAAKKAAPSDPVLGTMSTGQFEKRPPTEEEKRLQAEVDALAHEYWPDEYAEDGSVKEEVYD